MLRPEFPFRLVGMIHVENAITELARPDVGLPVDLTTSVMVEPATHNGARFCELRTVGEQQGRVVFECRSRYLAVRGKRQKEGQRGEREVAPQTLHELVGEWSLSTSAGRRYAAVSGDWNPIHLWPLSARLFGMKGPIIHGMHTVAKACAKLEQVQGQRLTAIAARFKVPIELGSEVELRRAEVHYQVWCGGKLAVEGTWR